jgi:hypothetical protein
MFPRWLPLYLVGLAALTLFPFTSPGCPASEWATHLSTLDFAANLLAFVPIGLALHRSPFVRTLLLAFGLSLAIELSQQWLPRQPDTADLASNTFGAAIGRVGAAAWIRRWSGPLLRPVTWRLAVWSLAPLLLLGAALGAWLGPKHDLTSWASFPLVIGNSVQGDRPWLGEIAEVSIYDRALPEDERIVRLADTPMPALWMDGGPILWIAFSGNAEDPADTSDDTVKARIDGPSGPVRASLLVGDSTILGAGGLTLAASGLVLDPWMSDHVTDRLREAGEMTLDVRMRAGALRQYGPARIVELGDGRRFRNFMLGQMGGGLIGMIRTPASGRGGATHAVETAGDAVRTADQDVRLTYDGSNALLWIDGMCEGVSYMALAQAPGIVGPFLGITIVASIALAALALAWLAPDPRARLALGLLGGSAAWLLLLWVGAWGDLVRFTPSALALGALSLATTLPLLRNLR